jgi:hypothetical protein
LWCCQRLQWCCTWRLAHSDRCIEERRRSQRGIFFFVCSLLFCHWFRTRKWSRVIWYRVQPRSCLIASHHSEKQYDFEKKCDAIVSRSESRRRCCF